LFYDLVYVIAISRITHHLAVHPDFSGLLDFVYLFAMVFWGWLNGSLYHDLHASSGLRTRLMTLWQMMIVAAIVVALDRPSGYRVSGVTISIMVMQLYITYLWWSVGIYDKQHRRLNKPYTIIYLISFALLSLTLFLDATYARGIFYLTLFFNYLPPFFTYTALKRQSLDFDLSPSMSERMGLFTIILFGEVVVGVVNGMSEVETLDVVAWLCFATAVSVVFSLWWIFFTLVSDRHCKRGLLNSSLLEIIYVPTLMALGLIAATFSEMFKSFAMYDPQAATLRIVLGASVALFFFGMNCMLFLLEYPPEYEGLKKRAQWLLLTVMILFGGLAILDLHISLLPFLVSVLAVLLCFITALNIGWYSLQRVRDETEAKTS